MIAPRVTATACSLTSSSSVTSLPSVSTSSSSTSSWSILSSVPTTPLSSPTPSGSLSPLESGVRETIEKITEITQLLDIELKASRQERDKAKDELKRCREAADSRAAEVSALEAFHDSTTFQGYSGAVPVNYPVYARFCVSKAPPYTAETLSALIAGECWGVGKAKGAPSSNTDYGGFDWRPWGSCSGNGAIYVHPRVVVRFASDSSQLLVSKAVQTTHYTCELKCPRVPRPSHDDTVNVKFVRLSGICPQSDTMPAQVEESDSSHQGPTNMKLWMNAVLENIVCKPTSLLDPVSIPTNLLFKDSMKAWVIVATMIAVSCEAAEHLPDANILASARQESSTHGIGSMDAKFTSVQVPQFKSDLCGGAIDIVAVAVGDAVLVSKGSATRPVAR
ncbi:hypothetical protein F5141DRAFT_1064458 [Pisolithus sp. B1]|nr:hypothetical protein F5141DRAFT_1064458 [Pisolithus sp. B1]